MYLVIKITNILLLYCFHRMFIFYACCSLFKNTAASNTIDLILVFTLEIKNLRVQVKSHFGVQTIWVSCEVILFAQIRDIFNDSGWPARHDSHTIDVVVVIRLAPLVRAQAANIFEYF